MGCTLVGAKAAHYEADQRLRRKISGGLSKSRNLGPLSQGLPNAQLLASRWKGGFGVLKHLKLRPLTGRL